MTERIGVGVLGATGRVGERLLTMLADHPWFEVAEVGASERSAGSSLGELAPAAGFPSELADLTVRELGGDWESELLLSALPSSVARAVEADLAAAGHLVVSNASAYRADPAVPLVIPEVNPDHLELVGAQTWAGGIVTNPNCVIAGLSVALAPLHAAFGLERVSVTTFQAISGAGSPGPAAFDLVDNVIPHIAGEEEKIASEPRKILGRLEGGAVHDATFRVDATAVRVPVLHGHLAAVSVELAAEASTEDVRDALRSWGGALRDTPLPTSPEAVIELLEDVDRPQPRLDRDRGGGMTVSVGRVRPGEAFDASFLCLSHNLVRGAAGAALLNAELCAARGMIRRGTEVAG